MTHILWTALFAIAGALVALRLKIPAGAMIGSMVAVAALNIATGYVHIPPELKILTQTVAGGFIGLNITRKTVRGLRGLIAPTLFVVALMVIQGVALGYILHAMGLELDTALLAAAPGGIVDMSLISVDMGADTTTVAILHTVRLSSVILICPHIIRRLSCKLDPPVPTAVGEAAGASGEKPEKMERSLIRTINWKKGTVTFLVALAGGVLGYYLGIPAGVLMLSMITVAAFGLATNRSYLPAKMRSGAQVLAGAIVGQGIGMEQVIRLKGLILPAVVAVVFYITCNILIGLLLARLFKMHLANAMFATTPAGVSDMVLIAGDMGVNDVSIAVMHIARLVGVIAVFPTLVTVLVR